MNNGTCIISNNGYKPPLKSELPPTLIVVTVYTNMEHATKKMSA